MGECGFPEHHGKGGGLGISEGLIGFVLLLLVLSVISLALGALLFGALAFVVGAVTAVVLVVLWQRRRERRLMMQQRYQPQMQAPRVGPSFRSPAGKAWLPQDRRQAISYPGGHMPTADEIADALIRRHQGR